MRLLLLTFALCFASVLSQTVIDITNIETTISNIVLAEDETLRMNFYINPYSITFLTSTLHRIPEDLFSQGTLEHFAAPYASIADLEPEDFNNATNLRTLNLQFNILTELSDFAFTDASNLEVLLLTGNQISTVGSMAFEGIPRLRVLSLFNNRLVTLPSDVFHPIYSLVELDLGFNQLSSIDFPDFSYQPNFDTLWLEGNQLSNLDEDAIVSRNLRNLFLYANSLQSIGNNTFARLPSLEVLSLHSSGISEVEPRGFYGLRNLETLILYSNSIGELPSRSFQDMYRLRTLDLGSNGLSSATFGTFAGLDSLDTLWLDRNNYESFNTQILIPLRYMRSLLLAENEITDLDFTDIGFILPSLNLISLQRNRWVCESLADIIANLRQFRIMINQYPSDYGQILLEGVQCTEGPAPQEERLSMNIEGRRELISKIAPYALKGYQVRNIEDVVY